MRIALLTWESLHSIRVGGLAAHVSELARALTRKGNRVHVFTRRGHAAQRADEEIDGVIYHRCTHSLNNDFLQEIKNLNESLVTRFRDVERQEGAFDVIHAHDWMVTAALNALQHACAGIGILTVHSTEYGRCGNQLHDGRSAMIRAIEAAGIRNAARVIAVSKSLKSEVQNLYSINADKIDVVYNGIELNIPSADEDKPNVRNELNLPPDAPLVLFVGRMVFQKGPDLLLWAAPTVLRRFPAVQFVFAGEGEMRGAVEAQAQSMGLSHSVHFLGDVPPERTRALYKTSNVVCVPSRNEPFGLVVLEAWRAHKPVVTTDQGGPGEIVWHGVTGSKVPTEPDAIANAIIEILADEARGQWMGQNGRIALEEAFSWDFAAEEVLATYHSA